ncbi:HAMP domain-containing histidine kinase [Paenibacillus glycanilyticus]|uniref:sensor histidine kinase n=1 Tax=Paenibacillus glycanilyticus TaxID=126569 RepID=UPI002040C9AB|nr:HAMP domain-containing sensor histidine kinase [Paenibacillus glycanilyticus]MCM3625797.1 HAMP domain-containing histidine kinase [Paenibacillus glycanilyticus]
MRISIKLKFSVFLVFLLLLTVFILSLLVLEGIKKNQQAQLEQFFSQQAATANVYFIQTLMGESRKVPQTYLASNGRDFARQLELITGQSVVLYDQEGTVLSSDPPLAMSGGIRQTLDFALNNKTAYLIENDSLYYFAPLRIGDGQVGVIQFYYSLTDNLAFYNQIKLMFIYIGASVFILSFILAYFYFNSFASGIIKLNRIVDQIRAGNLVSTVLRRKDEIGQLSKGIHMMSEQIMKTMRDKDEEREKLALAVRKLSQLDQQQKQFIGNVTHEFKTPLTSIKSYIDLLDMYPDDDKLLDTAKANILGDTQRLYEMVEKVLHLSALEKYEFEFHKEKLDVRQELLTVLDSLKGKMDKFGITVETDLIEAYVDADKEHLSIVLMNLMDNAIKYNKTRGRIFVKTELSADQVIIEIADTGIGIPSDVAHKIFDPFFTVDRSRSREIGSTGLGLSLAKQYTESQGGSLTLVHTDSEGTLFRIVFPAYGSSEA